MAAYEVLLLNTAIPQIQAAQSGDTYVVPRDIAINASASITGNLGIGTSAPVGVLDVVSSGSGVIRMRSSTGSGTVGFQAQNTDTGTTSLDGTLFGIDGSEQAYVYNYENAPLIFGTNSAERMRIEAAGNVGIGTSAPGSLLQLNANNAELRLSEVNTYYGSIKVDSAGGLTIGSDPSNVAANSRLIFSVDGTERARIDSAGTVFMRDGTSTTNTNSSKLVVGGTISETVSSTQYLVASQYDIGTAPNDIPLNQYLGSLAYQDASSIAGQVGLSAGTAALPSLVSATDTDTGMWFPAANTLAWSVSGAEAMRLNSSGNLGIGTTSPAAKLDISAGNLFLTQDYEIQWKSGATTRAAIRGTSSDGLNFYTRVGGVITNTMSLDSSGNLGLGVTPSAWGRVGFEIGVVGAALTRDTRDLVLLSNAYWASGGLTYAANAAAGRFDVGVAGFKWYTAPSGTAGNLITFTQAMTLTSGGDLLVGTTSALNSAKLTVSQASGVARLSIQSTVAGNSDASIYLECAGTDSSEIKYLRASQALTFITSQVERARITSGGNFLVGLTTDPGGTGTISARSTTAAHLFDSTSGTEVIGISKANGNKAYLATVSSTNAGLQVKDSGGTVNLTVGTNGNSVSLNGASPQTGTGITFPATQSASSNANTLDDYEEGTWTPAATAATAPTGVTYNFQGGWYRKIGSLVIAGFGINIASVGTGGSGEFRISGFPFTSATNGSYREPTASLQGGRWVTSALAGQTYLFINDGATVAGTRYQNNADTAINWSDIQGGSASTGTYCLGVIAYYVA